MLCVAGGRRGNGPRLGVIRCGRISGRTTASGVRTAGVFRAVAVLLRSAAVFCSADRGWNATFCSAGRMHSIVGGWANNPKPWRAVQRAAWQTVQHVEGFLRREDSSAVSSRISRSGASQVRSSPLNGSCPARACRERPRGNFGRTSTGPRLPPRRSGSLYRK